MLKFSNPLLSVKVLIRQAVFYAQHPHFLSYKQKAAVGLSAFLLLFSTGGLVLAFTTFGSERLSESKFRVENVPQEVLGRQATPSGSVAEATPAANIVEESEPPPAPDPAPVPAPVVAQTNRINFPVNKFGVHAFAGADQVDLASQLVNTNGGDWGWITLTMNINHRDAGMWNSVFRACREKRIIPIIQLSNDGAIPSDEQLQGMADFLHSLEWPTKMRFISVFNEVNASEYWGWEINPESYAQKLDKVIELLRGANPDYFIMNGAFNASARTGRVLTDLGVETSYLSEDVFLQRMNAAVPGIFTKLDGWASHCYPHPAYTSHPLATATPTLRDGMSSYKWELSLLSQYGAANLPVFITETGWPHEEGTTFHPEWHDQNTVAEYYKIAMRDLYGPDGRVVAVTPFILKYDGYDNFAFVKPDGTKYPQWDAIVSLPKTAGNPPL